VVWWCGGVVVWWWCGVVLFGDGVVWCALWDVVLCNGLTSHVPHVFVCALVCLLVHVGPCLRVECRCVHTRGCMTRWRWRGVGVLLAAAQTRCRGAMGWPMAPWCPVWSTAKRFYPTAGSRWACTRRGPLARCGPPPPTPASGKQRCTRGSTCPRSLLLWSPDQACPSPLPCAPVPASIFAFLRVVFPVARVCVLHLVVAAAVPVCCPPAYSFPRACAFEFLFACGVCRSVYCPLPTGCHVPPPCFFVRHAFVGRYGVGIVASTKPGDIGTDYVAGGRLGGWSVTYQRPGDAVPRTLVNNGLSGSNAVPASHVADFSVLAQQRSAALWSGVTRDGLRVTRLVHFGAAGPLQVSVVVTNTGKAPLEDVRLGSVLSPSQDMPYVIPLPPPVPPPLPARIRCSCPLHPLPARIRCSCPLHPLPARIRPPPSCPSTPLRLLVIPPAWFGMFFVRAAWFRPTLSPGVFRGRVNV
jgi:hypothetical protein